MKRKQNTLDKKQNCLKYLCYVKLGYIYFILNNTENFNVFEKMIYDNIYTDNKLKTKCVLF